MKIFNRPYNMNEKENQIFSIIVKITNHQDTLLLMDPLRDVYYMDNKKLNYFVMVSYDTIKITNHKFYYTNQISFKFSDVLIKKIKLAISKDRNRIEKNMFKNELDLLNDIDSKISINKPRHEEIIESEKTISNKVSNIIDSILST